MPENVNWKVKNVEEALNELYESKNNIKFLSSTILYDTGDFDSGGTTDSVNYNYITKSYSLSENDINLYKAFVLQINTSGVRYASYLGIKNINVPNDSIFFENNTSHTSIGSSQTIAYIIEKQTETLTISAEISGHARMIIYGLK